MLPTLRATTFGILALLGIIVTLTGPMTGNGRADRYPGGPHYLSSAAVTLGSRPLESD